MKVIVYSKRNCIACKLVTTRLDQWRIPYEQVFDHHYSAPTIMIGGKMMYPPITTRQLRNWLTQLNIRV